MNSGQITLKIAEPGLNREHPGEEGSPATSLLRCPFENQPGAEAPAGLLLLVSEEHLDIYSRGAEGPQNWQSDHCRPSAYSATNVHHLLPQDDQGHHRRPHTQHL